MISDCCKHPTEITNGVLFCSKCKFMRDEELGEEE